jgi:hypothetical protein
MRRLRYACLIATAAATLSGCAGFAAKGTAEQAVAHFHEQLDTASFEAIYDESDDLFKGATTKDQFVMILRSVHTKLGTVVRSDQTEFYSREQAGTDAGSYISMTYATQFTLGKATEKFNYRLLGTKVRLVGYNIS